MKKLIFAAVVVAALCAVPAVEAAPPGFYSSGYSAQTFPVFPGYQNSTYNYYASPYGYRTFNTSGVMATPFGFSTYNYGGTYVRPYSTGPYSSVYWNPFLNQYQYTTGYMNTPTFYQGYRWGWGW